MTLALGIDIGTSGIRTAVIDPDRTVVASARADHFPQTEGKIDALLWWDAVCVCLKKQIAALTAVGRSGEEISGIAVDGTSGSMVLTDANLNPVSRALMYNSKGFDAEALQIAKLAPNPHITRGANSALARGMRLVSEVAGQPKYLMHQADYVAAKLMGRGGLSDHNNALKTGFDPEAQRWPEWADQLIDPKLLPDARSVGSALDQILPSVAKELNLPSKAVVYAGTTDSIAAFLACGPLKTGVAVTSLGSTLAIKVLSKKRIDDPAIGLYSHKIGDLWLVGGASNTGGAVLAHYFDKQMLIDLSKHINPETISPLDYYPLNQPGERFPINDPAYPPRLSPRPESDSDFLHGMLEGIAKIERAGYQFVEDRGGQFPEQIFTAGGGASNPVWTAIRARVLGIEPTASLESEASVGAASLALG